MFSRLIEKWARDSGSGVAYYSLVLVGYREYKATQPKINTGLMAVASIIRHNL